jgi:hypothetical protein
VVNLHKTQRKYFNYPATNVLNCNESIATDIFFSNVPAKKYYSISGHGGNTTMAINDMRVSLIYCAEIPLNVELRMQALLYRVLD